MATILLVDGMNLAWKAMHAFDLATKDGVDTSAIYGFMMQLASVLGGKRIRTIVVWDGGYPERTALSKDGISKGLIKLAYKETRSSKDPEQLKSMDRQLLAIRDFLSTTDVKQVCVEGQEADDVVASYCEKIKSKMRVLCLTCDHDYYQIIDDNVNIVSRLKGEEVILTKDFFVNKYKIQPYQWVDIGALCGDSGDCIEGVVGCGEETALQYIREHHTVEDVIARMSYKFEPIRAACPDLMTAEDIAKLIKEGGEEYEGCYPGMPFSGVALALVRGEIKKIKKVELKFAMYQEKMRLAYKLKKMNRNINVPNFSFAPTFSKEAFEATCQKYEMNSLTYRAEDFCFEKKV
jgi:DNA polymerase-1